MRNPDELEVYRLSEELVFSVYAVVSVFPKEERYNLTSQIKRAAVSVCSNIAEGCSRESQRDFARFLEIALGSVFELSCQLSIARRLGMADEKTFQPAEELARRVSKMLGSLGKALRARTQHPVPSTES